MLATTCFTRDELKCFLHGRTDDILSGAIEEHLETCPQCEETLSELDAGDDTLIRTLQVKTGGEPLEAPAWVARMADMPAALSGPAAAAGETAATDPPAELGDYELVSVLGRGGMSVVFSARHKHLGREVALKVLLPNTQQHAVSRDRFAREMRAVGGLSHPAIIRATDAGEFNETLYLVMEQIDGVDLNRVSKSEGPLRIADACAIGIEVARGLAHAHQQGVVHRDIKPSNVMLDRCGNVKILDFGLARMQSAGCDVSLQTTMGQLLGTLDYMAPEQASGCEVDARADIYALGATLFKLLTGIPPHGRSAELPIIEFLNRLATRDAKRLDAQRDQLPAGLVELVAQMLARDPERRMASAEEVAERLEPFAATANLRDLAAHVAAKTTPSPGETATCVPMNLAEIWTKPWPAQAPPGPPPPSQPAAGPRRIGGVGWAALATGVISLCGLVALTIVLTLKSPEGEIRIESELDNVKVEVVDEKDRVDVISVEQGAAITTVRAGRYRIRLESPATGIEVTPQEVIVTKDKIVIAKVRKAAKTSGALGAATPQRDPFVAMEAQVQLAKTMDELTAAKQQAKPNADVIKSLEDKLSRLRALSRPIPTEPVYEGRTLADWVAQMNFEQEATAKKVAAGNVLKLAVTRPDEERMKLILDAGSRLLAWDTRTLESRVYDELTSESNRENASSMRIAAVDRQIAVAHLVRALQSEDRRFCDYALSLCAYLRSEIQQGQWPGLPAALEARAAADGGAEKVTSQLVFALCAPDATQAAQVLAAIDTGPASEMAVVSLIYAASDRNLKIPRDREIAWVGAYLDRLPYLDERNYYSGRTRSSRDVLFKLWIAPTLGPFRNADWDHVDDALQGDINAVVGPLLRSFAQRLAGVAEHPHDAQVQLDAAVKSTLLTRIVNQVNLTGQTQQEAVDLLGRRLEQLLQFRARHAEAPDTQLDSPAGVAVAIKLLTGAVPAALKQLRWKETGFLAEQLEAVRGVLVPPEQAAGLPRAPGGASPGFRTSAPVADWYPYEMLATLHESITRSRAEREKASLSGFGTFGSSRANSAGQLVQSRPTWQVDPRLMLDFAGTSPSAAETVGGLISSNNFTQHLVRHPEFIRAVTELMEGAQSQEVLRFSYALWSTVQRGDDALTKLLAWLKAGDAVHARFALQTLGETQQQKLVGQWADDVAGAIERIAAQGQLYSGEMFYLEALGDKAPHAAEHAIKYLEFWLDNPAERDQQAQFRYPGNVSYSLKSCLDILSRSPAQVPQAKAMIQKALDNPPSKFRNEDRERFTRFLTRPPQ